VDQLALAEATDVEHLVVGLCERQGGGEGGQFSGSSVLIYSEDYLALIYSLMRALGLQKWLAHVLVVSAQA
jgi:hypothetical protein